ncbi:MAG: alginate lyase family protein, partial [Lentisphaeria bacterium]|nr:alginate lyase family protein [Lentisphaeria bacterium]
DLPEKLYTAVKEWFAQYLQWLCNSNLGATERLALNNHSVCWYLQAAAFAHLTENEALLEEFRNDFKSRLLEQIAPDGSLPEELERTKPYGYELFTLEAFAGLAALLSVKSDNYFLIRKDNGGTVFEAVNFMCPYIEDKNRWFGSADIKYFDYWPVKQNALYLVNTFCGNADFKALWQSLPDYKLKFELVRNYPVRTPELWIL